METLSNPYLEWSDEKQKTHRLDIIDRVFIGRVCKGIDETRRIIIDHPAVSRDHVELIWSGSQLQIKDVSKNGTWINGVRISGGRTEHLTDGDILRLGETSIFVACPDNSPSVEDDIQSEPSTAITTKELIVTNVVADVRGFTSISQVEKSHQVYELMKNIFKKLGDVVKEYKGTIKDYAGDAIFAFWEHGINTSKEQAKLACQNALIQAEALNSIKDELQSINLPAETLKMGWGVTTGPVTMSHYGSRAFDMALVGDCVNLAFRLSGMANKELDRKIIICDTTANLISDSLLVEDLGEVTIRGRKGQLHVFGL